MTEIIKYVDAEIISAPPVDDNSRLIDQAIAAWLHAKTGKSHSVRTSRAYADTIGLFRGYLQATGNLDVDSPALPIALAAQVFAGQNFTSDSGIVAASTHNLRLAILSSFYKFVLKKQMLPTVAENPIERVDRRSAQAYENARSIEPDEVKARLAGIDRSAPDGMRDYALLMLALTTGRRVAEVAALRWRDLRSVSGGKLEVHFRRCKGGKQMTDQLAPAVTAILVGYLKSVYPGGKPGEDYPLWLRFDPAATRLPLARRGLSSRSLQNICEKRVGTSRFHSLRHTFAHSMEQAGAKVSDIQAKLGHESLETTGRYLKALKKAENEHADDLAKMFGL